MDSSLTLNRSRQSPAQETTAFGGIAERFRRAGDLDRAIALCREGLQKFPEHLSARVTLGWALLDKGNYDAAQVELEQVLKRAPDNLAAIRGLAELHERAENAVELSLDGPGPWPPDADAIDSASATHTEEPEVSQPAAVVRAANAEVAAAPRTAEPDAPAAPPAPRVEASSFADLLAASAAIPETSPAAVAIAESEVRATATDARAESVSAPSTELGDENTAALLNALDEIEGIAPSTPPIAAARPAAARFAAKPAVAPPAAPAFAKAAEPAVAAPVTAAAAETASAFGAAEMAAAFAAAESHEAQVIIEPALDPALAEFDELPVPVSDPVSEAPAAMAAPSDETPEIIELEPGPIEIELNVETAAGFAAGTAAESVTPPSASAYTFEPVELEPAYVANHPRLAEDAYAAESAQVAEVAEVAEPAAVIDQAPVAEIPEPVAVAEFAQADDGFALTAEAPVEPGEEPAAAGSLELEAASLESVVDTDSLSLDFETPVPVEVVEAAPTAPTAPTVPTAPAVPAHQATVLRLERMLSRVQTRRVEVASEYHLAS